LAVYNVVPRHDFYPFLSPYNSISPLAIVDDGREKMNLTALFASFALRPEYSGPSPPAEDDPFFVKKEIDDVLVVLLKG
jgi:hypothetical protein|tara:strand:- start:306 stop:542 length:237 start_codon:yes stop_codon:yes gene_type:complete